jgi:hydroxymethylglutaryl-CoA synthase
MAYFVPPIYLDLQTLAPSRNLEYDKLSKGLGVLKMALPDACEDAASMAANAVAKLLSDYQIDPQTIGRLYVGTESGLDGSKPIATYVIETLNAQWQTEGSPQQFSPRCDALDMTFACIGGVDALQNTLDWVRSNPSRVGIVVCTDYAKYEKYSGGEYTQGAGAVAMLIKHNPRLLAVGEAWGVSTKSEHDFFKPGFSETPVFDGQFSNACYQNRLADAYADFTAQLAGSAGEPLSEAWHSLVFHLPYAFHGKRMFPEIFAAERTADELAGLLGQSPEAVAQLPQAELVKAVAKSAGYNAFVQQKIAAGQLASSQIGNMYTASIFMGLMSCLETHLTTGQDLTGQRIGFCAYGSGSKSKVFEGTVQPGYQAVVGQFGVFAGLAGRQAIGLDDYERLHDKTLPQPLGDHAGQFVLASIAAEPATLRGARHYARA